MFPGVYLPQTLILRCSMAVRNRRNAELQLWLPDTSENTHFGSVIGDTQRALRKTQIQTSLAFLSPKDLSSHLWTTPHREHSHHYYPKNELSNIPWPFFLPCFLSGPPSLLSYCTVTNVSKLRHNEKQENISVSPSVYCSEPFVHEQTERQPSVLLPSS